MNSDTGEPAKTAHNQGFTMNRQADPTKTDVYGMASDEQIRELLASGGIPDRLRARLMREVDRRAAPRQQTAHRTAVKG